MKQVILIRKDLKMPPGKLAAQVAHASVDAVLCSDRRKVDNWLADGAKKVVLKVADLRELKKYAKLASKAGLVVSVIKDAGHTYFKNPTVTCAGIGPDGESVIDTVTGELKML